MRTPKLILLICLIGGVVGAKNVPSVDGEFASILAEMKKADGYTFRMRVKSTLMQDTSVKMSQEMIVYTSPSKSIKYTSSADEVFFGNDRGYFKSFRKRKEAGYVQFKPDSSESAKQRIILAEAEMLADSVMFRSATKVVRKHNGDVVHFHLEYPPGYTIKALDLRFNKRKSMLESISYTVERPMNQRYESASMVRQVVVLDGYKKEPPPELSTLIAASTDFKKYLSDTYPGFTIHPIQ